ncbi:TPA: type-F conjugative transfer system protein TrbI [Escherichia coli]|nr:type-F conjugative transfer system protein TrbI [Escherichia coli]
MTTKPQVNGTPSIPEPARNSLTQRERRKRRGLLRLLLVAAAILCINATVTTVLIRVLTPTVVMFDMKGTVDQFTEQAGARFLDETQTNALTERFMRTLNTELQDYQRRHDVLILVTPAVVSGATDITGDIQSAVAQKMTAGEGQ